jgi:CheY-like chemotaxis protein
VLVVDDEDLVRSLIRRFLEHDGYVVYDAANGDDALRLMEQNSDAIGLMITDVVMPGLSGVEVAARLRQLHPSVGTIFMSGYKGDTPLDEALQGRPKSFLQKPFSRFALLSVVRSAIGPPPG